MGVSAASEARLGWWEGVECGRRMPAAVFDVALQEPTKPWAALVTGCSSNYTRNYFSSSPIRRRLEKQL